MKKLIYAVIACFFIFHLGCNNSTKNKAQQEINIDSLMIEFSKESDVYINTDGTLTSYLYLAEINDSIIEFSLLVLENDVLVDLIKSKQAISPGLYQDPEIDEDEEGVAYPAQQYFYETADCWISVRIDIDTNNKAKLNIGECQELQKITHELDMKLFKKKE